jgi:hypothetical protein
VDKDVDMLKKNATSNGKQKEVLRDAGTLSDHIKALEELHCQEVEVGNQKRPPLLKRGRAKVKALPCWIKE